MFHRSNSAWNTEVKKSLKEQFILDKENKYFSSIINGDGLLYNCRDLIEMFALLQLPSSVTLNHESEY